MKSASTMIPSDADEGTPVSIKIRERLLAAKKRFNANDNIAEFIETYEVTKKAKKAEKDAAKKPKGLEKFIEE